MFELPTHGQKHFVISLFFPSAAELTDESYSDFEADQKAQRQKSGGSLPQPLLH